MKKHMKKSPKAKKAAGGSKTTADTASTATKKKSAGAGTAKGRGKENRDDATGATKNGHAVAGVATSGKKSAAITAAATGRPVLIDFDRLEAGHNARTEFDQAHIDNLAESIASMGLKERLIVYPHAKKAGRFAIHGGECRYRALGQLIKAKRWSGPIPCEQQDEAPESTREVVGLLENLQRKDLSPADKARGLQHAIDTGSFVAWDEKNQKRSLGHLLGFKSKSTIYGLLILKDLCKLAFEALQAGKIPQSVAEKLARIRDPKLQGEATTEAIRQRWTDDEAEERIRERYQRQLKGAAFDVNDATLVPRAGDADFGGPCATCPQRSGNQREMFGEFAKPGRGDMCLRPSCFAEKALRASERALKAHADAGGRVLSVKEAESAGLTKYGNHIGGAHWIGGDLDKFWIRGGVAVNFPAVAAKLEKEGKLKPALAVANDGSGQIFKVYPRKETEKLIAELPEIKTKLEEQDRNNAKTQAEREVEETAKNRVAAQQRKIVSEKLEKLPLERLVELLVQAMCRNYDFNAELVLAMHGWIPPEPSKGDEEEDADDELGIEARTLMAKLKDREPAAVLPLLIEGWLMPQWMDASKPAKNDEDWKTLCAATGTTPEAVWMGARELCGEKVERPDERIEKVREQCDRRGINPTDDEIAVALQCLDRVKNGGPIFDGELLMEQLDIKRETALELLHAVLDGTMEAKAGKKAVKE
jgi:hypothetical protein